MEQFRKLYRSPLKFFIFVSFGMWMTYLSLVSESFWDSGGIWGLIVLFCESFLYFTGNYDWKDFHKPKGKKDGT